jgi:uncharacterized membrane protein
MMALATIVAAYAVMLLVLPPARPPFMQDRFATIPLAAILHLGGAAIAIAVGSFQHNRWLRSRFLNAHRWMGRAYVVGVVVGGLAGLKLATMSQGGLPAHVGFGLLAVLWIGTTAQAYRCIRAGDQQAHRRWMTRSFALTLAAVTLRLYIPASVMAGLPFLPSYQTIAWLCWVPNLIVAEWVLVRRAGPPSLPLDSGVAAAAHLGG